MEYTTQALAKEAKITPRTLRHYDQIGLLRPKIRLANGRSIYGLQEALILFQILRFRDFGFSLKKIATLLNQRKTHTLYALKSQKTVLLKEQSRLNKNLELIELMIEQLKQEKPMEHSDAKAPTYLESLKPTHECIEEYCESPSLEQQAATAFQKLRLVAGEEYYQALREKGSRIDLAEAQLYGGHMGQFFKKMKEEMDNGVSIRSQEVQELVKKNWEVLQIVYPKTTSKKVYLAIRDQIFCSPLMQSDDSSAQVANYIAQAMEVFAEDPFSEP